MTLDAARPTPSRAGARPASARRGENVDDLLDPGSFVEYGAFADRQPAPAPHGSRT